MKIAISGSACTGKTTLGQELARRLDLPFIPEQFDTLFKLPKLRSDERNSDTVIAAFRQVLELKQADEKKHRKFVVDRCPLDLMNLWLTSGLGVRPVVTEKFYQDCQRQMARYDFVVVPRWGKLPLEPRTESGKQVRNLNRWSLLHSHATILGLARMWLRRGRLIVIPEKVDTIEDQVNFVLHHIRQTAAAAPAVPPGQVN